MDADHHRPVQRAGHLPGRCRGHRPCLTGAAGDPRDPGPDQYYISPALAALLCSAPADELADRYPGHQAGLTGEAGLPSPDSLIIIVGRSAAQMSHLPGAAKLTSFNTTPPSGCGIHSTCVIRGVDKTAEFTRTDPARAAADYARLTEEFKLATRPWPTRRWTMSSLTTAS